MKLRHFTVIAAVLAGTAACSDSPDAWRDCEGDNARDHVRVTFENADDLTMTVDSTARDDRMADVVTVEDPPALYVLPATDVPAADLAEQFTTQMPVGEIEIIRC